jgi:hypothetical protein
MTGDFTISAPHLSEDEAAQALAPGGFGDTDPGDTARGILLGLQRLPMYGGTVDHQTIAKRRKDNKAAAKSRKINRRSK